MATSTYIDLDVLLRARYSLIYVVTHEETRVESHLCWLAQQYERPLLVWSVSQGLRSKNDSALSHTRHPIEVLEEIERRDEPALIVLRDFHPFLSDLAVTRKLRELAEQLRHTKKNILLVSPLLILPTELEKDVTVVDYSLPNCEELQNLISTIEASVAPGVLSAVVTDDECRELAEAALGLTYSEAENAFARSVVEHRRFVISTIVEQKRQILRKGGLLDYVETDRSLNSIGGLEQLKIWIRKRGKAFTPTAREFGLPRPNGCLLVGVPGCGKSLTAKAVANEWRLPLLKLDMGQVFGGLIGESEQRMRDAIASAEAMAPCVLWVDEADKGLSGIQSNGISDGGTSARVFGTLLSWLQERSSPVFVVATANRVTAMAPEMLRKGRFDETFFVDLPRPHHRAEIIAGVLSRYRRDPRTFDVDQLGQISPGFSASELEETVISAMWDAFDEHRELRTGDIESAIRRSVPASITFAERLDMLRYWAAGRLRPAEEGSTVTDSELDTLWVSTGGLNSLQVRLCRLENISGHEREKETAERYIAAYSHSDRRTMFIMRMPFHRRMLFCVCNFKYLPHDKHNVKYEGHELFFFQQIGLIVREQNVRSILVSSPELAVDLKNCGNPRVAAITRVVAAPREQ